MNRLIAAVDNIVHTIWERSVNVSIPLQNQIFATYDPD